MSKADVAAERKDQIVKATVECITKFGYHNFSMQDVARAAGVSKGIIHYYFLNKDDLMMSVLAKVAGDIEDALHKVMIDSDNPEKRLRIFMEVVFDVVIKSREYYQVNMDFWTQINQKEEIREIIATHYQKFRETAQKVVEEGMSKGDFKKMDSFDIAAYIIGAIDGLSLQYLFDPRAFDYEKMATNTIEMIIGSLKS